MSHGKEVIVAYTKAVRKRDYGFVFYNDVLFVRLFLNRKL